MRLLIDTHVLLWAVAAPERLSDAAREALSTAGHQAAIGTASLWEIAIKVSRGRLDLAPDWQVAIERGRKHMGARWLTVEPAHCGRVATLPWHHRDPFDRMLIAQALCENMTLISKDSVFAEYPVDVLW